jgi:hypothetical protein
MTGTEQVYCLTNLVRLQSSIVRDLIFSLFMWAISFVSDETMHLIVEG